MVIWLLWCTWCRVVDMQAPSDAGVVCQLVAGTEPVPWKMARWQQLSVELAGKQWSTLICSHHGVVAIPPIPAIEHTVGLSDLPCYIMFFLYWSLWEGNRKTVCDDGRSNQFTTPTFIHRQVGYREATSSYVINTHVKLWYNILAVIKTTSWHVKSYHNILTVIKTTSWHVKSYHNILTVIKTTLWHVQSCHNILTVIKTTSWHVKSYHKILTVIKTTSWHVKSYRNIYNYCHKTTSWHVKSCYNILTVIKTTLWHGMSNQRHVIISCYKNYIKKCEIMP